MTNRLEEWFPNLVAEGYRISSLATDRYNCIAWAANILHQWWWPSDGPRNFWPAGVLREESMPAFVDAFRSLGYEVCANGNLEFGFEKIVLFSINGMPTHAARQLPNGSWTSKLGELEDIEHTLDGLNGSVYGTVTVFMKRSIT